MLTQQSGPFTVEALDIDSARPQRSVHGINFGVSTSEIIEQGKLKDVHLRVQD